MKKISIKTLGLLFLFSTFFLLDLDASEVVRADVKKVALNAFSYYSGKSPDELKVIQEIPVMRQDTALLYVYNFENGFIIVAADNVSEPILGFGLDSKINLDDIPPALEFLLECYQQEILHAKRQNVRSSQEVNTKWNDYLEAIPSKALYVPATWLIETKWGQSGVGATGSTVAYNHYCPTIVGQGKTIVGCNGVALAQILNFWKCSVHPQGTAKCNDPNGGEMISIPLVNYSYSWGNMSPDQSNYHNAQLLYHCAVAMNSRFGINLTSAAQSNAPAVLNRNFGFTGIFYNKYSNQQNWVSLLKTSLDKRRPIYYAGYDASGAGGHAWVVDGYNSSNQFHCNFGWKGNGDGWYSLSAITPSSYNFQNSQSATVDIYPTYYPNFLLQNITINSNTYAGHTITVDNCIIQNNANVILDANCATEIFGPFTVPLGAILEVR
ncbi:C10 family peptidase [Bacteroidales bacterium OttesenSCG-928-B11]|nr:C10 family peptidase [Bacteroidales bacterium OttesenSCG-928-B11]